MTGMSLSPPWPMASHLFKTYIVIKLEHGFLPSQRVEIHRVQMRAVEIEDSGF
jgi:hypothetical protein